MNAILHIGHFYQNNSYIKMIKLFGITIYRVSYNTMYQGSTLSKHSS